MTRLWVFLATALARVALQARDGLEVRHGQVPELSWIRRSVAGALPHGVLALAIAVASASCQPLCGLVFGVVLPEGADASSALEVEATATDGNGRRVEPDRLNVAHTARGFVVEVAYFEPGVDVAPRVWVDVDGDGERGPGDLEGEVRQMSLDGSGCDSMTTLDEAVVLAPIPSPS